MGRDGPEALMNFYNISNHPSTRWSEAQLKAAKAFVNGDVVDVHFPNVPPAATSKEVQDLAWFIMSGVEQGSTCMIMGESSLVFGLVMVAFIKRCNVVVSTTERKVVETAGIDGVVVKTATFEFCGFRDLHGCGAHALACLIQEGL